MASLKKVTRKLSGRAKDRFFDAGLSPEAQKAAVTSVRVRKEHWPVSRDLGRPVLERTEKGPDLVKPSPPPEGTPAPQPQDTPPPPTTDDQIPSFDSFQFGLVPVYKREGAEGLARKLAELDSVENLRAMAKDQQIVLPREVRRGEVTAEEVRKAIVAAVEQRVSDRRAQL